MVWTQQNIDCLNSKSDLIDIFKTELYQEIEVLRSVPLISQKQWDEEHMGLQTSVWFEKPSVQDNAGTDFIKMNISQPLMNFTTLALQGPNLFFSYCSWGSQEY